MEDFYFFYYFYRLFEMGNLPDKVYKGHGFFKRTKKEQMDVMTIQVKRLKEFKARNCKERRKNGCNKKLNRIKN